MNDGLVVGNDEKSTTGQSSDAMNNLVSKKDNNVAIVAKAGSKTHKIIAPVHTHPIVDKIVDAPSGEDTKAVKVFSTNKVGFVIRDPYFIPYNGNSFNSYKKSDFLKQVKSYGYDYTIKFYINAAKKIE